MKPIVEFICLKCKQVRKGKRAYLIPLIPNENGIILPKPVHIPAITVYYTRDHFETFDTIYVHYTGTQNPFVCYKPSPQLSEIREGEYSASDEIAIRSLTRLKSLMRLRPDSLKRSISMLRSMPSSSAEILPLLSQLPLSELIGKESTYPVNPV